MWNLSRRAGGGERCSGLTVGFAELKPGSFFSAANAVRQPEPEPGALGQFLVVASICSQNVVWAEWSIVSDGEKPLQSFNIGNDLLNIHTHSIAKATSPFPGSERGRPVDCDFSRVGHGKEDSRVHHLGDRTLQRLPLECLYPR